MNLTEVKTSELTGAALDWAVAQAVGLEPELYDGEPWCRIFVPPLTGKTPLRPFSTDWSQGGPLIERLEVSLHTWKDGSWEATVMISSIEGVGGCGQSPLIAACRAIVATELGETVQVPAELVA